MASSLPPIPVSRIRKSTFFHSIYRKAMAVSISKDVGWALPSLTISSHLVLIIEIALETYSLLIYSFTSRDIICSFSRYENTVGEIYMPTLYPAAARTEDKNDMVEPFPLVPAT